MTDRETLEITNILNQYFKKVVNPTIQMSVLSTQKVIYSLIRTAIERTENKDQLIAFLQGLEDATDREMRDLEKESK